MMSSSGRTQPSSSGSQRLATSPVYFTLCASSSSTSFGSSTRVVEKARDRWRPALRAALSCPRMAWSLTVTSATLSPREQRLELAVGDRPARPGASRYAWTSASSEQRSRGRTRRAATAAGRPRAAVAGASAARAGRARWIRLVPRLCSVSLGCQCAHRRSSPLRERQAVRRRRRPATWSPSPNSPCEHAQRQRVEHAPLDRPLQRPRAVHRVVALVDEQLSSRASVSSTCDLPVRQPPQQAAQLDVDDLRRGARGRAGGRTIDLVDAVQELRPEVRAQRVHHLPPRALVELGRPARAPARRCTGCRGSTS